MITGFRATCKEEEKTVHKFRSERDSDLVIALQCSTISAIGDNTFL